MDVDDAFKDPQHPFRIAIVCAMWLTGFDVECLSTLYIDKPMKAHTLMQAIARANRVYPGKDCGVIVDYNGMLKSLREALAQYALGDEDDGGDGGEIVAPIEELVEVSGSGHRSGGEAPSTARVSSQHDCAARRVSIESRPCATQWMRSTLRTKRSGGSRSWRGRCSSASRRCSWSRASYAYAERHDNIEAIYKKLEERRDTADVTEVLKELHRIVNEAIRAQAPGEDHAEGLTVDLSQIDFEKLRDEFAKKVRHKHAALQDIRDVVEEKLQQMLARNPLRMDYYRSTRRSSPTITAKKIA